jgi:PBP1b-binding outer membrane lipoprotein LpoB
MKKILAIALLGLFLASCSSTYYHVGTGTKMNKKCGSK